jgi:predicted N-acetyltransferase YhbS
MPESTKVRRATIADFHELLELINLSFGKEGDRRFEKSLPHLYGDAAVATERAYLAELDGRLVGHIGIYPIRMTSGEAELSVGGIGAVACHPDYRGHGVMSALLPAAIRGLEEAGHDLSILWGARSRYRRYGWDDAGKRLSWRVEPAAVTGVAPIAMRPADHDGDLAILTQLWNSDTPGTAQTELTLRRLLRRRWTTVITPDQKAFAMYQIDGDRLAVDKLVGPFDQLPGLLAWLRTQIDTPGGFVLVRCPTGDHPLAKLAVTIGEHLTQTVQGMVRIVNADPLAVKLRIDPRRLDDRVAAVQALFGSPIDLSPAAHSLHIEVQAYV